MSSPKKEIVKLKKGNINDPAIRKSLITKLLLPTSIFFEKDKNVVNRSYSFLEIKDDAKLKKFYKSLPYFELLKNKIVDSNYKVEEDDFFQINSNDLFILQAITEFTNFSFDYDVKKNHYQEFLIENDLEEINDEIISLNAYVNFLSKLFDLVDADLFNLANGFSSTLDNYLKPFEHQKIAISKKLYGRTVQLDDLIKKIKLHVLSKNEGLFKKIKTLELDSDNEYFIIQKDFLEFVYLILQEVRMTFSKVITNLIIEINKLWGERKEDQFQELESKNHKPLTEPSKVINQTLKTEATCDNCEDDFKCSDCDNELECHEEEDKCPDCDCDEEFEYETCKEEGCDNELEYQDKDKCPDCDCDEEFEEKIETCSDCDNELEYHDEAIKCPDCDCEDNDDECKMLNQYDDEKEYITFQDFDEKECNETCQEETDDELQDDFKQSSWLMEDTLKKEVTEIEELEIENDLSEDEGLSFYKNNDDFLIEEFTNDKAASLQDEQTLFSNKDDFSINIEREIKEAENKNSSAFEDPKNSDAEGIDKLINQMYGDFDKEKEE
ncbi:MAG: hypothetical protein ACRCVI_02480 [Mycoplasmoidaceae bacterium]